MLHNVIDINLGRIYLIGNTSSVSYPNYTYTRVHAYIICCSIAGSDETKDVTTLTPSEEGAPGPILVMYPVAKIAYGWTA